MSHISYEKNHSMSVDQAKAALTEAFEKDLDDFDLDAKWKGNICELTGKGAKPVVLASLVGMPMPLCSCSVLPAALALRREGASRGATAARLGSLRMRGS